MFSKSKLFLIFCVFFILCSGVFIVYGFNFYFFLILSVVFVSFLITIVLIKNYRILYFWFILFFSLLLSLLRIYFFIPDCNINNNVCFFNNKGQDLINGIIYSDIELKSGKLIFDIKVNYVNESKSIRGKIRVNFKNKDNLDLNVGNNIYFSCELKNPENFDDFKYDKYLALFGVYSICDNPKDFEIIKEEGTIYTQFLKIIFKFRNFIKYKISQIFKDPFDGFLLGLLIGVKDLPKNISDSFRVAGISHIIAISGYNITLIINVLNNLFLKFKINRFNIFYIILGFLIVFTILTGCSASVVRASIMGIVTLLGLQFGRMPSCLNVLVFVAFLMIFINPYILIYDVGFQLSFLATLGLIFISPIFENFFKSLPDVFEFRSSFCTSLAAIFITLPITWFNFKSFSVFAILVNILVLPIIPLAYSFGFFSLIVYILFPFIKFLYEVLCDITYILLDYVILVAQFFSKLSFSSLNMPEINGWHVITLYTFMIIIYGFVFRIRSR